MIDLASTRMARICGERGAALIGYANDRDHMVSVGADFAHRLSTAIGKTTSIGPDFLVKAVQVDDPASPEAQLLKQYGTRLQKAVFRDIGATLPELKGMSGTFELFLSTSSAVEAFTDPKRESLLKPALKTSKALLGLMNAVEPLVPGLTNNPYFKWASAIVTVGDFAYGIWAKSAPPPPSLFDVPVSSLR